MPPRLLFPSALFFPLRAVLTASLLSLFIGGSIASAQAQATNAAAASGASATTTTAAAADRAGTIKLVNGKVTASSGRGDERPLAAGDPVFGTDKLSTGSASSVSLVLRDGTTIVLGPSSRMELRGFAFDTTTYQGNLAVMVLRGSMRMISGLIRKNNANGVHIETPTAVIGIRGTDFIVDVDPAGEAR